MEEGKSDIQEMPPPYHVGQPISTPNDIVKKDEAGYPPQEAGYPIGLGPTQNFLQQGYYPAPQQGYPLQPCPQNNVVVVGQPVPAPVMTTAGAAPTTLTVQPAQRKAKDFLLFSVILMLLFLLLGGIPTMLLILPALICSLNARGYNRNGNYIDAKQCGYMALGYNIAVIAFYVIGIIIAVIVFAVVFSTEDPGSSVKCSSSCRSYNGYEHCSSYC